MKPAITDLLMCSIYIDKILFALHLQLRGHTVSEFLTTCFVYIKLIK